MLQIFWCRRAAIVVVGGIVGIAVVAAFVVVVVAAAIVVVAAVVVVAVVVVAVAQGVGLLLGLSGTLFFDALGGRNGLGKSIDGGTSQELTA